MLMDNDIWCLWTPLPERWLKKIYQLKRKAWIVQKRYKRGKCPIKDSLQEGSRHKEILCKLCFIQKGFLAQSRSLDFKQTHYKKGPRWFALRFEWEDFQRIKAQICQTKKARASAQQLKIKKNLQQNIRSRDTIIQS